MPDREKVIKGLEEISDFFFSVYHHSKYREEINEAKNMCDAIEDAIALLKEQEAKQIVQKQCIKEYYDWDDGCYEKYEPDEKGWRYGAKKSRYSEEIKDELVSLMIKYLENHDIFRLLELVVSAVATKEQEGR